jgi:hypothetical protein
MSSPLEWLRTGSTPLSMFPHTGTVSASALTNMSPMQFDYLCGELVNSGFGPVITWLIGDSKRDDTFEL